MDPRARALERQQAKRRFQRHALIYAVALDRELGRDHRPDQPPGR